MPASLAARGEGSAPPDWPTARTNRTRRFGEQLVKLDSVVNPIDHPAEGNALADSTTEQNSRGILAGIRVLDVASYIAAPISTTIMADFGAEVIKVEPPAGDVYRKITENPGLPEANVDYHWQVDNRNKHGLAIDLTTPGGQEIIQRLVKKTDVFVTNFTRPARAKLKLRWEDLQPLNEQLIYASLTAYGETGPESAKTGFDSTAYWARTGLMHMVRPEPSAVPARSLPGQGDHPTGVALFGAIMLALYDRQRTGRGAKVHTSLLANGLWSNAFYAQSVLSGGNAPVRPHRSKMPNALTNHYRCRDDHWFILSVVDQERGWGRLLGAIERHDLGNDPRFATRDARTANATTLIALLDDIFAARDYPEWRKRLDEANVTFGSVGRVEEIPDDEQMTASGALAPADPATLGADRVVDTPLWVDGTTKSTPRAAPTIGEHTEAILHDTGFSDAELRSFRAAGVFGDSQ